MTYGVDQNWMADYKLDRRRCVLGYKDPVIVGNDDLDISEWMVSVISDSIPGEARLSLLG